MLQSELSLDQIPVAARFSALVQTSFGTYQVSLQEAEWTERGARPPAPSCVGIKEAKERVGLYLCLPPYMTCSRVNLTLYMSVRNVT